MSDLIYAAERRLGIRAEFKGSARRRFYDRMMRSAKGSIPPDRSLETRHLRFLKKKDVRRHVIKELVDELRDGTRLSDAMAAFIPPSERLMIASGEMLGRTEDGFHWARYVADSTAKMAKAVKGAMTYPVILCVLLGLLLVLTSYRMVPVMLDIAPLEKWPPVSKLLHTVATGVTTWGLPALVVLLLVLSVAFWSLARYVGPARSFLDRWIPPYNLYREYQAALFLIALSALMKAGRPFEDAVHSISAIASPWLKRHMVEIADRAGDGRVLSEALNTGLLPADVVDDIEEYCQVGSFDAAIGSIGEYIVDDAIERLTASAMVIRILLMFAVAGGIVLVYAGMVFLVMTIAVASKGDMGV